MNAKTSKPLLFIDPSMTKQDMDPSMTKQDMVSDMNADFSKIDKNHNLLDRLRLSTPAQYNRGQHRNSTTPSEISIQSVLLIVKECIRGLNNLREHVVGLEDLRRILTEIYDTLSCRSIDIQKFQDSRIDLGPSETPIGGPESPKSHPYSKPVSDDITLSHWIYDLQKYCWILNEKILRYENIITTPFLAPQRKKKLDDLGKYVHSSWVNLMLHLGLLIGQSNMTSQEKTAKDLTRLAIASGLSDDMQQMDMTDVSTLYLQGEKYLLGYGVPQSYDTAFQRYIAASKHGSIEAHVMIGVMYEFGIGTKKDLAKSSTYYQHAAAYNNAEALNHLGRLNETGKGCEISLSQAAKYYQKAAGLGLADAITNYGYLLEHGLGIKQNQKAALEQYKVATDKNHAKGINSLATCYYKGVGTKKDYFQAAVLYRQASDLGYPPAQNNLGICFEQGHGVPYDIGKAKSYYKMAADKHHAGATNNLGCIQLLEKEYFPAMETFYHAKRLGRFANRMMSSLDASFHLGYLFEIGCKDQDGVIAHQDLKLALRYYQIAGEEGHAKALLRQAIIQLTGPVHLQNVPQAIQALQDIISTTNNPLYSSDAHNMLGELCELGLQTGQPGKADISTAIKHYSQSIQQGHDKALFNLAAILERGMDQVERNMNKAVSLYREAKRKGNKDAEKRLDELMGMGVIVETLV